MSKEILKKLKPLSKIMEEQLMELHERELLLMDPSPECLNRTCTSLLKRKLAGLKEYTVKNKSFYAFYITPLGVYYLSVKCKNAVTQ